MESNKVKVEMTREQYDKIKSEYLADQKPKFNQKGNPMRKPGFNQFFKMGKRGLMKRSLKTNDQILVFLLNLKKQIEGPILTKIYGGNFLVIRNRVYRFNPDRVFSFGKYKSVIAREFDRELVGVDDYQDVVMQDFASQNPGSRVNIDDPVLIKALIQAKLGEGDKKKSIGGVKAIVIGVIVVAVVIGFFMMTG